MNTAAKNIILLVIFTLSVSRSAPVLKTTKHLPASIAPLRSRFKVNTNISTIAASKPAIQMPVRLQGRKLPQFLQIASDGTVNGTDNCDSKYAKLELQAIGYDLKRIKGTETGLFVAMNSEGNLYSTNSTNDETFFRQTLELNSFHAFASAKFYRKKLYDTFISLYRSGAGNGKFTKSAQFLMLTDDLPCPGRNIIYN